MAANVDRVVLDACVLYPAPLRDLLLSLASAGLFQARWTRMIEAEWITSLLENRTDLRPEALARTAELMNQAIDGSLVEHFEHLIDSITLPDPDDRHVLAAAIACQATTIVTFNIRDFGQPPAITILHPDDFCTGLYAREPEIAVAAIQALRRRLRRPSKTAQQLIETYERHGLPKTSRILRANTALL
ncbi:PIN domain-containing protein [Pseudoduganella sp. FT55W]|uniref:PIN domain-containing protein n=1 Tax=Duganella rivi TaxID=2666083 RepID=A0A7X4GVG6_9BURK|nr:PIN domain-containing protein [Duganella rivi]MYM69329.1 PIN domain-containing protein [Duganella rivi]